MNSLIDHVKSPDFWVFSVVLAIILSTVGNYATRFVDLGIQFGINRLRALSSRNKEKRAARIEHINHWIETHANGAVLVLSEAHFLSFLGMSLVFLTIGVLIFFRPEFLKSPSLVQLVIAILAFLTAISAIATLNLGATLLEAVRKHPTGLEGLHPRQSKPSK